MKKSIRKLKIGNDFFGVADMDLFSESDQALLVYGANGTGKTTIGKGILQVKNGTGELSIAEVQDDTLNPVAFSDDEKKHIHVFNEDFIEGQVSFKTDPGKMNAIVMFGKNVDNEKTIETLNGEIENLKKKILDLQIDKYDDPNNVLSPLNHLNSIKRWATSDWAEEEKKIRGIATKPYVKEDDIDKIINCTTAETFDKSSYESKKNALAKLVGDPQQILNSSLSSLLFSVDTKKVSSLLKQSFERPVGTDMAKRISSTISQKGLDRIEEIQTSFAEGYCPYCFRDITSDYVSHIIEEINKTQNEGVKKHISDLKASFISEFNINLFEFKQLDNELCLEIEKSMYALNKSTKIVNDKILFKINNPYDSIDEKVDFSEALLDLNTKVKELESKRLKFNADVKNKATLKQEVQQLNYARAANSLIASITSYKKQLEEKKKFTDQIVGYEKEISEKNQEILKLNAESKNIGIALNEINTYLGLIFLSKDRLSIEAVDGKYHVKVRNKPVSLKKLSNGERNAIALCYFFVSMNSECSEEDSFKAASFVVLDDPLSSFDYNNKVGIYSFLRRMIAAIVKNKLSKVMVMTHQIETFFDMDKILDDINGVKKKTAILKNKLLENYSGKTSIYKILLKEVYSSAQKTEPLTDEEVENLGNKLRKVLEAFSTFNYGCGIDELSTDEAILKNIKDDAIRKYLEDSLYRISLNTTSHFKERTYSLIDLLTIGYFERDGLIRSVKDSLLLLYSLNRCHVMKILEINDSSFFDNYITYVKSTIY